MSPLSSSIILICSILSTHDQLPCFGKILDCAQDKADTELMLLSDRFRVCDSLVGDLNFCSKRTTYFPSYKRVMGFLYQASPFIYPDVYVRECANKVGVL